MNTNTIKNTLTVTSPAFSAYGDIPPRHTMRGENLSPPLEITGLGEGVQSIAVMMDDLDVPFMGKLNHWLIWNLPPSDEIPEGIPPGESLEALDGAVQGMAWGKHMYKGPQPPFGQHRYRFRVYALNARLQLNPKIRKKEFLAAIQGHVLQVGELFGLYRA